MNNNRDYLMDNIKALMLFCVAFGHILDVYKSETGLLMNTMKYVYLFHMPMFAFVTGYFTKKLDKARNNAVQKCLIPYIILQGCYCIMAVVMIRVGFANFNSDVFKPSLLVPTSAFYYLLAVFFWKVFAKDVMRMRYPIAMSFVLGLLVSCTENDGFHVGYGAVFSLLVFFVMGVSCTSEMVEKIRSIPKFIAMACLVFAILPAIYLPYAIHSVRTTYSSCGFTNLQGIGYRLVFYVIATILCASILCLMPNKKSWYSSIGKASITVYAGSTFLAPHGYIILNKFLNFSRDVRVNFIAMMIYCVVLVWVCSLPIFGEIFDGLCGLLNKSLFSEKNGEE